jgi:predicted 2-oxoglutarate/Fe(II)-dependent dioxygenase YbiX
LRSTEVRWIRRDEYPDVFNLMQEYGRKAQAFLGIDKVLSIKEPIQLSTYHPGDFYGWHKDGRVMSCSVLLTDKFTGGRLEFREPGQPLLREAGKAIFFANIEHRVKPVLTGRRDSLVVWWR